MNSIQTANYILSHSLAKKTEITPLKLQKLIYYLKVWSIIDNKPKLIYADFKKWNHGPVNKEVYYHYKKYGSKPIPLENCNYSLNITIEEENTLNFILENYLPIQAISLSLMTHREDPWCEIENNEVISDNSIYEYYSKQLFSKNFPLDFDNKKYYPVISNESYAYYADMTKSEMKNLLAYPSYNQYMQLKEKTEKNFHGLLKRSLKQTISFNYNN
ncbi:MAG: DUF4065 domain-containing protein [Candidatus Marinimicrobia bacterium]|nr:DUF4065 domain-containing protein [Candidatus Neomarinimicrobiota bacterium]